MTKLVDSTTIIIDKINDDVHLYTSCNYFKIKIREKKQNGKKQMYENGKT
jgi:hypothetical protein